MTEYIHRSAEKTILEIARVFPVVTLTGPRQSGKTTLARRLFADKPYVSLESPDAFDLAANDARQFFAQFPNGAVIDEAQRVPEIFSWLQTITDESQEMGQFVVTGSQNYALTAKITQSLAGRAGMVRLLPFAQDELRGVVPEADLDERLFAGGYPPIYSRGAEPAMWLGNYVQTYIERDVHQLLNVRDLSTFRRFLALCAGRCGQLVNLSSLAADAGITRNTAAEWLSVLEAGFIVFQLRPYFNNYRKRLVKSSKLYFYDTGLLCSLLGIREPGHLTAHPLRGAIFESYVISEIAKKYENAGQTPPLWFWRDSNGHEVDLLIQNGPTATPVEIKSGRTFVSEFFNTVKKWNALAGTQGGAVACGGDRTFDFQGSKLVSWRDLSALGAP